MGEEERVEVAKGVVGMVEEREEVDSGKEGETGLATVKEGSGKAEMVVVGSEGAEKAVDWGD